MLSTPAPEHGAMPRGTRTPAAPPSPLAIAKVIQLLQTTESADLSSVYGPTLRGLVPKLFAADGTTPLTTAIRLILDDRGRAVGVVVGNDGTQVIDYRVPECVAALWHASNSNLARSLRDPPIEERLARAFTAIRLDNELLDVLAACGLPTLTKLHIALGHKLAFGIISECVVNATTASQQGSLNLLRSFAPTIRYPLIAPLLAYSHAELIRDTLAAAPILALAPKTLVTLAGNKPKLILKELGLPVEARHLRARALSPYRMMMLHDGRDLAAGDAPWLTPEVLNALPPHALNQYRVVSLAFDMLLGGAPTASIIERVIWAAMAAAELFKGNAKETMRLLADWLRASPAALKRFEVRAWAADISAEHAIAAARDLQLIHEKQAEAKAGTARFPVPDWANRTERLPKSKWHIRPIRDEAELIAAGRRNRNCAAIFADACRAGSTVIVELIRPIYEDTGLPNDGTYETGAMAEIAHAWGQWQVIQIRGWANAPARPTAVKALDLVLAEVNGTPSNPNKKDA